MCYTYDSLSRVISRVIKSLANDSVISTENYTYDAAGNMTDAPDSCFQYDTNSRLVVFNGNNVTYDLDGNMLNDGVCSYTYDSANRLKSFGGHTYTYTSADIRIRNLCADEDTTYTYDTNSKLSKLLTKTTNGVTTKYLYGRGLIGEQTGSAFKTYHFDCRGSTMAITDVNGNITDTFAYDTYGNLVSRTGTSKVIFLYNGRDGVITDDNGLYYMRARYYSPEMRRFVNADIVAGQLSNAVTLNRFAYANGNPVSFVDPFGLSVDSKGSIEAESLFEILNKIKNSRDKAFASQMLAATLDQLLSFKNVFTVSNKLSVEIPIGLNTTVTYSTAVKSGSGNIELSAVVAEQLEIAGSFSFPMGDNGSISIANDGTISIEYSADIDKYNTIAVSISSKPGVSISAGYTITTTDAYDNAVSTSIELTYKKSNYTKPPLPQPEVVPEVVPSPSPQPETKPEPEYTLPVTPSPSPSPSPEPDKGYDWGDFGKDLLGGVAVVGGSALITYAVANNATIVGFIDDWLLIPLGTLLVGAGA